MTLRGFSPDHYTPPIARNDRSQLRGPLCRTSSPPSATQAGKVRTAFRDFSTSRGAPRELATSDASPTVMAGCRSDLDPLAAVGAIEHVARVGRADDPDRDEDDEKEDGSENRGD